MKLSLYSFCGLFLSIVFTSSANTLNFQYVPEFIGGLDIEQIQSCKEKYDILCMTSKAKTALTGKELVEKWSCMEDKMSRDKACVQAYQIQRLAFYPPEKLKKYGPVTVFNVTSLADAQQVFYLVDTKGKLISLTSHIDLHKNKTYRDLEKEYPKIALTTFLHWKKLHEDLFPQSHVLHNHNQALIFQQTLRDGGCLACATVGIAEIAYEFTPAGIFVGSHLEKIISVPKKK